MMRISIHTYKLICTPVSLKSMKVTCTTQENTEAKESKVPKAIVPCSCNYVQEINRYNQIFSITEIRKYLRKH